MSKLKLSSITAIALLLILLIGGLSYGCTANKNSDSSDRPLVTNSNQSPTLSKGSSDSMGAYQSESSPIELNINTASDSDKNRLSSSGSKNTAPLNPLEDTYARLRPEIGRILQSKFSSESELETALKGASILQDYLDRPNQDAVTMLKRYDCSVLSLTQADQNLIQSLTFDTDARKNKIKNGLKDYKPAVSIEIQIDNQGNAISPCASLE